MSRPARLFAIFCGIVALLVGILIYYFLGIHFAKFAFNPEQRAKAVSVVRLDRLAHPEQYRRYKRLLLEPRSALLHQHGARTVFVGDVRFYAEGSISDAWNVVSIHSLERGSDFVDTVTSPEYLLLEQDADLGLVGTATWQTNEVLEQRISHRIVLMLCNVIDPITISASEIFVDSLREFDGVLIFTTAVQHLTGNVGDHQNRLIVYAFATDRLMMDWFDSRSRRSEQALISRSVTDIVILVADPQAWSVENNATS